jgi:pimeloyl-ACP methyl ester carboxylesterase
MGLPAFPGAHLLVFWGGVQNGFSGFKYNPAAYATQVQCPVLILHGAEDPRVTVDQAQAILQNLNGSKQFEQFDGVGHESYFEAQPDKWQRIILDFLALQ